MKYYLSYGGGINSTAMLLLLADEGLEFEAVYVDHGGDWPETKEYVQMISELFELTIIIPEVKGFNNIYEYYWDYQVMPAVFSRSCTSDWKIKQLHKYFKKPCQDFIGISFDERYRAKRKRKHKGIVDIYPLVDRQIDRQGCIEIIKAHGLPVPMKSGCFFCPFQKISEWKLLKIKHPELFQKAIDLEKRVFEERQKKGKDRLYMMGRPYTLENLFDERQKELFEASRVLENL